MAKVYCRKIRSGGMTIGQVPDRWKDQVLALLEADGESGADL